MYPEGQNQCSCHGSFQCLRCAGRPTSTEGSGDGCWKPLLGVIAIVLLGNYLLPHVDTVEHALDAIRGVIADFFSHLRSLA